MEKFLHYCQKCGTANQPGETSCGKCGTRLMIITLPPSLRHEEQIVSPSYYEDHLLERVSLLEFRLKQLTEQLSMAYDFINRQSDFYEKDHLLIASFIEAVLEIEPNLSQKLTDELSAIYQRKVNENEIEDKKEKVLTEILINHDQLNNELFSHLIREGSQLLDEGEEKQAFRTLARAALLSPQNIPLHLFIGEHLFRADKFTESREYLEKTHLLAPQNQLGLLLLGFIYANEYEAEPARKIISVLAGIPETKVTANLVWGMLAAYEGNWNEAIIAFKESTENAEKPELNYLIGSAYFQLQNFTLALEHLEKAVGDDIKFADAWFMISLIYELQNKPTKSETARQMVFEAKEPGAKSLKFLSKRNPVDLDCALPFIHFKEKKKSLLTNGSLRMVNFFKGLIYQSLD
jgi:tetratricopeptide (TPR) repeat protein